VESERALTIGEGMLRASLDALDHGVILTDLHGQVVLANRSALEIMGSTFDELRQLAAAGSIQVTHEDGGPVTHDEWRHHTMFSGEAMGESVVVWHSPRGSVLTLKVATQPVRGVDGAMCGVLTELTDVTLERRAQLRSQQLSDAVADAEEELRESFENAVIGMAVIGHDGEYRRVNPSFCRIVQREPGEMLGLSSLALVHPDDLGQAATGFERFSAGELSLQYEQRLLRADGSIVWVRVSAASVHREAGELSHVIAQVEDITATKALRATQARFAALVERSSDIICLLDRELMLAYSSPSGNRLFGAGTDTHRGRRFVDLLHPEDSEPVVEIMREVAAQPGALRRIEARVPGVGGQVRNIEMVVTNRLDDPDVDGIVANIRDITERAEAAAWISWQAYHDPLTALPNRVLLLDRMRMAMERSGELTALLYVDLDNFKLINDTMGHETGDRLLVKVAERLVASVRVTGTVARIGGDEFVVLVEAVTDMAEVEALADRVISAFREPMFQDDGEFRVTVSIGIAVDRDHTAEGLLRDADLALYWAKERGRNRSEIFTGSLRAVALRRVSVEQAIRAALETDGIHVLYQPIIDLESGDIVECEALLRFAGADGSFELPAEVVPIAEETGLIVDIGRRVLADACARYAEWQARLGPRAPRQVAVNVAARQLSAADFVPMVERTLVQHGLSPRALILELTETTIIGADGSTADAIDALHGLGVSLSLDDFGTGYSSLAYLKRFPVDRLKIDRAFVDGLGTDGDDTEIVRAVISLGHSLGLTVTAEGIESYGQLRQLEALGCDRGQGFLLARPSASADLGLRLAELRAVWSRR